MARDGTVEMAMKVLNHGPCYLATKPLGQYTVDNLWQHIVRVTGELPTSLTETAFVGQDEQGDSVAARFAPNIPRSPSLPNPPNSVAARFAPNIPRSPSLPNPPNSVAARFAPEIPRSPTLPNPPSSVSNFAGYTLSYVKERLDAWNNERARANNGFQAPSEEPKGATRGSEE